MTNDEILESIEKLAQNATDEQVKLNALCYLCGHYKSIEIEKETKESLAKSKEKSKEMSELLTKIFSDGFGG